GCLCAVSLFGLGRELAGDALAGAAAAALFVLQGLVTWEATGAFVELGLTLFTVLAAWYGVRWARAPSVTAAVWPGVFAGAAAGTKSLGLIVAVIVLAFLGVAALLRRRPLDAGAALLSALVAGGGWYLRNLAATGNPVYPFLGGGRWMTAFAQSEID